MMVLGTSKRDKASERTSHKTKEYTSNMSSNIDIDITQGNRERHQATNVMSAPLLRRWRRLSTSHIVKSQWLVRQ